MKDFDEIRKNLSEDIEFKINGKEYKVPSPTDEVLAKVAELDSEESVKEFERTPNKRLEQILSLLTGEPESDFTSDKVSLQMKAQIMSYVMDEFQSNARELGAKNDETK